VLIYAVKTDFFDNKEFFESVAKATVEKNDAISGKTSASSGS
jgi:hypothetical protein